MNVAEMTRLCNTSFFLLLIFYTYKTSYYVYAATSNNFDEQSSKSISDGILSQDKLQAKSSIEHTLISGGDSSEELQISSIEVKEKRVEKERDAARQRQKFTDEEKSTNQIKVHHEMNKFADQQLQKEPISKANTNVNMINMKESAIMEFLPSSSSMPLDILTHTTETEKPMENKNISSDKRDNLAMHWAADFVPPGMIDGQSNDALQNGADGLGESERHEQKEELAESARAFASGRYEAPAQRPDLIPQLAEQQVYEQPQSKSQQQQQQQQSQQQYPSQPYQPAPIPQLSFRSPNGKYAPIWAPAGVAFAVPAPAPATGIAYYAPNTVGSSQNYGGTDEYGAEQRPKRPPVLLVGNFPTTIGPRSNPFASFQSVVQYQTTLAPFVTLYSPPNPPPFYEQQFQTPPPSAPPSIFQQQPEKPLQQQVPPAGIPPSQLGYEQEIPSKPFIPSRPEIPQIPGRPEVPGVPPKIPGRPEVPGVPPVPQIPGRPEIPGVPPGPQIPGRPEVPGVPPGPQIPGRPEIPGVPPGPQIPGRPEIPGVPPGPQIPGRPEVPGFFVPPIAPKFPGKPEIPARPGERIPAMPGFPIPSPPFAPPGISTITPFIPGRPFVPGQVIPPQVPPGQFIPGRPAIGLPTPPAQRFSTFVPPRLTFPRPEFTTPPPTGVFIPGRPFRPPTRVPPLLPPGASTPPTTPAPPGVTIPPGLTIPIPPVLPPQPTPPPKELIPNRVVGKARVICEETGVDFGVRTILPFTGQIFAYDRKSIPSCLHTFHNALNINISFSFAECGIRNQQPLRVGANQTSAMELYHLQIIVMFEQANGTTTMQSYFAQCGQNRIRYEKQPPIPKHIEEALEELRIVPIELLQKAPLPVPVMRVVTDVEHHKAGDGLDIEEVQIGQQLRVEFSLQPETDAYGFLVRNCVVRDQISGIEHQVIDQKGCSTDLNIFGHPFYDTYHDIARVHWHAFKLPDQSRLSLSCRIDVCIDIADPTGVHPSSCASIPTPPFCPDLITSQTDSVLADVPSSSSSRRRQPQRRHAPSGEQQQQQQLYSSVSLTSLDNFVMEQHVHSALCFGNSSTEFCTSPEFQRKYMERIKKLENGDDNNGMTGRTAKTATNKDAPNSHQLVPCIPLAPMFGLTAFFAGLFSATVAANVLCRILCNFNRKQ